MERLRKNDLVKVISGKDKGRTGRVMKVNPEEGSVVVEGVNLVKRHQRANQAGGPSGIIEKAMPIKASKVMPFDAKNNKASRVRITEKDGKKIRVYATSGEPVATAEAK